jgi:hypothetical protein
MKVVDSSETSVNFYQTTKRNSLIITAVRISNITSEPLFNYRTSYVPGSRDLKDYGFWQQCTGNKGTNKSYIPQRGRFTYIKLFVLVLHETLSEAQRHHWGMQLANYDKLTKERAEPPSRLSQQLRKWQWLHNATVLDQGFECVRISSRLWICVSVVL